MIPSLLQHKRTRAFSLTELLIAVLAIGLLSVLVFPSLAQAQRRARGTLCQSNCGRIGLAFVAYSKDNDGQFVPHAEQAKGLSNIDPNMADVQKTWFALISAASTEDLNKWRCPESTKHLGKECLGIGYTKLTEQKTPQSPRKISDIKNPSRTVVFGDAGTVANLVTEPDRWQAKSLGGACVAPHFSIPRSADWSTDPWRLVNRHEGSMNAVFADGHVESTRVSRIGFQYPETDVRAHWDGH